MIVNRTTQPLLLAALLALSGCTVAFGAGAPARLPRNAVVVDDARTDRCNRAHPGEEFRMPLAQAEPDPGLAAELEVVPDEVRRTALAAGLEPVLARMLRDRRLGAAHDAAFVARRQAVAMQLASLSSQLEASVFAADCLGDDSESLLSDLEQRSSGREIRLTVASIVVGAAAAVGIGIWELQDDESHARTGVAIGSGVVAGALGIAAFVDRPTPIVVEHSRNLLAPIARGEDPDHVLPTFVLRMLTLPAVDGSNPREELLRHFDAILDEAVAADERGRAEDLIYGAGGVYSPEVLFARERMLDEVETAIAAISRDVELLQRWLGRAFDEGLLVDEPASAAQVR